MLDVVLVAVDDVRLVALLVTVLFPCPVIVGRFIVSSVFVLIGDNVTATLLVKF